VAVTADGRRAVSASDDRSLILWDLETIKPLATFTGDGALVPAAIASDGRGIVTGDEAGTVHMLQLEKDTVLTVESYYIDKFEPAKRATQGHFYNSNVTVHSVTQKMDYFCGDYIVPVNQRANKYIVYMLEPQSEAGFFAWNFFDAILGAKEGYSSYVFEETAAAFLNQNPGLKEKLEQRRASDSTFAKSGSAQLNFVFQNSPYYEPIHNRYPVYRVNK